MTGGRFYFSFRSPYSWLAYRDVLEHHPQLRERLDWRPFWEPCEHSARELEAAGGTFPYTPMSRAKHLYILRDVARIARRRGLALTWPIDRAPVWEVPHLGYLVARADGLGHAYIERVYRARWEEGVDICEPAALAAVADEIGLDGARVASATDDPDVREEGLAALLALDRDGVFGVPFFITGGERFWGTERLADFVAALDALTAPSPPPLAVMSGRTADVAHAGGCG